MANSYLTSTMFSSHHMWQVLPKRIITHRYISAWQHFAEVIFALTFKWCNHGLMVCSSVKPGPYPSHKLGLSTEYTQEVHLLNFPWNTPGPSFDTNSVTMGCCNAIDPGTLSYFTSYITVQCISKCLEIRQGVKYRKESSFGNTQFYWALTKFLIHHFHMFLMHILIPLCYLCG